ncbi:MAG: glutamate-semialdehyde -aminomutase-like protein, partial [Verrucomicrobiales bacterium]|nr:glutamate-semialdehyde -aminomutase-like protein [Verrucomicrobiales bacterium]
PKAKLTVKIPEGFAFYALFPEQYALAANDWSQAHQQFSSRRVLLVGIRSIGTSLSAVVTAMLRALGWEAQRLTVRPHGHPFRREVQMDPASLQQIDWALVIDEGPGASGSSMAAVAATLCGIGVSPAHISFLPGHAHGPGVSANAEVRSWWSTIPQFVVALQRVRWQNHSIERTLALQTQKLLHLAENIEVIDLSAGKWREVAFASTSDWPAVAPQFERMKFLCRSREGPAILWKFFGLAISPDSSWNLSQAVAATMRKRAKRLKIPGPLGVCHGFVGTPWITGQRLRAIDSIVPHLLEKLARYIAFSAGKPLTEVDARSSLARLSNMLFHNTGESLGENVAELTRELSRVITPPIGIPRYSDGQMAPHEWVRTTPGELVKTNCTGHDCDHTLIGPQPIHWDVVGTIVEWDLKEDMIKPFLGHLDRDGFHFAPVELAFYTAAYAAFRLGACRLATTFSDPRECERLERAAKYYEDQLRTTLATALQPA